MPEIIILSGIPCSGKSTFRKRFEGKSHAILCRDDVRNSLYESNYKYSRDNENKVTKIINSDFDTLIRFKCNIIIDNTHCKDAYILEWLRRIPKNYIVKIKFFDISLYWAHIRNVLRWIKCRKWIPIKVMNDMYKNYQKLDKKKYALYM
jgi:predicted kinase